MTSARRRTANGKGCRFELHEGAAHPQRHVQARGHLTSPVSGLAGEAVLVTGASKRIGRAIAVRLAKAECHVAVHFHTSGEDAEATVAALRAEGVRAAPVRADLAVAEERAALLASASEALGKPVRLLVNNASSFPQATLDTLDEAGFLEAMRVNAWAPLRAVAQSSRCGRRRGSEPH